MELLWTSSCAPLQPLTMCSSRAVPGSRELSWQAAVGWGSAPRAESAVPPAPGAPGRGSGATGTQGWVGGRLPRWEQQLRVPGLRGTPLPGAATGRTCFATSYNKHVDISRGTWAGEGQNSGIFSIFCWGLFS